MTISTKTDDCRTVTKAAKLVTKPADGGGGRVVRQNFESAKRAENHALQEASLKSVSTFLCWHAFCVLRKQIQLQIKQVIM